MSFIDLVLDSTKEYEAPRRFYYWAALSAISAVLKDSVWFDMAKNYDLYPNIYVLLYGISGARKGPPIAMADRLVRMVDNTRVINGRSSIEAIIKDLGTFETREGKPAHKDSCGFVVASELSSSIIANPAAMDIMTNLFDRHYNVDEWKYKLKVSESVALMKPTITWLSGTNEALFRDFLPEKNIHGGLVGRMFMIAENKPHRFNALMHDPEIIPDYPKLAALLAPMAKLKGPFQMEMPLRDWVREWYINFMTHTAPTLDDETGFVSRILDFVIKVGMILSAGRRGDMHLLPADIKESIEVCMPLIVPTKKVSQTLRKDDPSLVQKRGLVLGYILKQVNFTCARQDILKNLGLRIDHEDLDKVINLLQQMQVVNVNSYGGDVNYSLKKDNPKVALWIQQNQ